MRPATVAIVGRPNVGKSTLFNRIVGGRRAIVDMRPGVTRDRHFARAEWNGKGFWLIDTGGWTTDPSDPLSGAIRRQVETAVADADLIVFVVDTIQGVHPADQEIAQILRPHRERVLVVANKADDLATDVSHLAFHELGLGDPQPVSAGTGKGSGDLLDRVAARIPDGSTAPDEDTIQVAVVGRPNVGKSSLVNRLLGEERLVVSPEGGTTRDAVDSPLRFEGKTLNFIDTAGLRRRSKVEDEIEFYSNLRTERAIDRADVCVMLVDAAEGVHAQDLRIAAAVWERGPGLILAVNKWDLIEDKDAGTAYRGQQDVAQRVPFLEAVPFLYVSALTGQRVRQIPERIIEVAAERERRVPTAEVNRVLHALTDRNQPPQHRGQEVKVLYGSQVATRPPTFAVVASRPKAIDEAYRRYLERGFRQAWGFVGSPMRIRFRARRGKR